MTDLIQEGADVNAFNSEGYAPLYVAISEGKADAVEVLLEHDANISAVTEDEQSASEVVRENENERIENMIDVRNEEMATEKRE